MTTAVEEINVLIEKAVNEKTFSLEALDSIKRMRDDFKAIEDTYQRTEEAYRKQSAEMSNIQSENISLKEKAGDVTRREKEVEKKEKEIYIMELNLKHAEQRREDISHMFETVFRNTTIRESVTRYGSKSSNNGYANENTNESETREVQKQ